MRTQAPRSDKRLLEIGFWADPYARSRGPDPRLLVDPAWAKDDRARLVGYLENGIVWRAYLGYSFCRFECGIARERMGSRTLTDGIWAWPQGLAHYVAEHQIALPDQFLEHARAQSFQVDANGELRAMPEEIRGLAFEDPGSSELWHRWAIERKAMAP